MSEQPKRLFIRSIFFKMFLPIICIMLIQAGSVIVFLFASNTMETLNRNAIEVLDKNVQNRSIALEHQMVHFWSNIDHLEQLLVQEIDTHLALHQLAITDIWGHTPQEIDMLEHLAPHLIQALHDTTATGVFMYFLDPSGFSEQTQYLNGLYYRDLSLLHNITSNLIFARGHVDIARRSNLSLDSTWDEFFTFDPAHTQQWRGFAYPQLAAAQFPDRTAKELSFWNGPHGLAADTPVIGNQQITYNRPLFFQGQLIAMIGTEIQLTRMERLFPAADLDNFAESGYMLLHQNTDMTPAWDSLHQVAPSQIFRVTGPFINRLLGNQYEITLTETHRHQVYRIAEFSDVLAVQYPLRLYSPRSAFANHQWLLAAVGTEHSLYAMTRRVTQALLLAALFSVTVGSVLVFFTIKRLTAPLTAMTKQLEAGSDVITYRPSSHEIDLLYDTINHMTQRRIELHQEVNRAKTRFLARMSHELRTPISSVLGISEIQLNRSGLSTATTEAFHKIHDSGTLLLSIVNDILDFSKIESGKMTLVNKAYQIPSMVSYVSQLHLVYVEHKNIDFHVHLDEQLPSVLLGDSLRIRQILNNLLSNAFKYTQAGQVNLSIGYENKTASQMILVLQVTDTGQGMSPEQLDILKTESEYIRFGEQKNHYIVGTGLGIPIVSSMVQMMGGQLHFESQVGQGTRVTVHLPQKVVDAQPLGLVQIENLQLTDPNRKRPTSHYTTEAEPMPYGRVLVVDDVDTNLFVARGLLEFYALQIETCTSGQEAIDKIAQGQVYDIVFMDHMMPHMDGIEALHILRDMGYTQPVVVLTANAITGQSQVFLQAGFDDFISKPIQTPYLHQVLCKFVRDKQPPEVIAHARKNAHTQSKASIHDYLNQQGLSDKLRQDFAKTQQETVSDLTLALARGEFKTARRLAHNLHNFAGLMGEAELAHTAKAIELALAGGQPPPPYQLDKLEELHQQVLAGITPVAIPEASASPPLTTEAALAILNQLIPLLQRGDVAVLDMLTSLRQVPESEYLQQQIADFEFAQALDHLQVLIQNLETKKG